MRDSLKLSILVPMVPRRLESGVSLELLRGLFAQADGKPVEVLGMLDNKRRTLGEKRNDLLRMAKGEYVAFVDDDDAVSENYVGEMLGGIASGADVVTFTVLKVTDPRMRYRYFLQPGNENATPEGEHWGRPTHLSAWRADLARRAFFPKNSANEHTAWANAIPDVKTQHEIGKVLYFFRHDPLTSETSRGSPCARDTVWKDGLRRKR